MQKIVRGAINLEHTSRKILLSGGRQYNENAWQVNSSHPNYIGQSSRSLLGSEVKNMLPEITEHSCYLTFEPLSGEKMQLATSLVDASGLSFDLGRDYLDFDYSGRDTNRKVVRLLSERLEAEELTAKLDTPNPRALQNCDSFVITACAKRQFPL